MDMPNGPFGNVHIAAVGNQDAAVVDKSGSLQFSARRHALP